MAMTEHELADALAKRRKEIEGLKQGLYPKNIVDRAYVVNVSYNPAQDGEPESETGEVPERVTGNVQITGSAQVNKDTLFYAAGVHFTLFQTNVPLTDPAQPGGTRPQQYTARAGDRAFNWRIRDTGQDREWQNTWLPSTLLLSNNERPLMPSRGLGVLSGGAIINVDLMLLFDVNTLPVNTSYDYRFVFFGAERRLA